MARKKDTAGMEMENVAAASGAPARTESAGAEKRARSASGDTVVVALNRASGIVFALPDGRRVRVAGNALNLRGKEKGVLPVGAFGLTEISADDWSYIEKTYGPHMEIFKSGLIFARAKHADAVDEAEEKKELRHGLEPMNVETAATKPYDGVGI